MSSPRRLNAGIVGRFLASGALNTIVGFGIIALALAFGLGPNLANFLGYAVALGLAFIVQRAWVYSGRRGHPLKFVLAVALSFGANLLVLNALLFADVQPLLAQLGAMGTYTLTFLLLTSFWVFQHPVHGAVDLENVASPPGTKS